MFSGTSRGIPSFGDLSWKRPVIAATSLFALNLNTLNPAAGISFGQTLTKNTNGSLNADPTWSGVVVAVGDRVLVRSEGSPKNGIYTVTSLGSAGSQWVLTRATDADTPIEMPFGTVVFTDNGGGQTMYYQTAAGAWITVPFKFDDIVVSGAYGGSSFGILNVGGALIANAGLSVGSGLPRPGMATYRFDGISVTGTGTVAMNEANIPGERMPFDGRIVAVGVSINANRTAGTIDARPQINGAATVINPHAVINGVDVSAAYQKGIGPTFVAGDKIRAQYVSNGFLPTTAGIIVTIYVTFDQVD